MSLTVCSKKVNICFIWPPLLHSKVVGIFPFSICKNFFNGRAQSITLMTEQITIYQKGRAQPRNIVTLCDCVVKIGAIWVIRQHTVGNNLQLSRVLFGKPPIWKYGIAMVLCSVEVPAVSICHYYAFVLNYYSLPVINPFTYFRTISSAKALYEIKWLLFFT